MVDVAIAENDRRIQLVALAAQVQFTSDFLAILETDFTVERVDNSVTPGVLTTLVLNVDYTVTGLGVTTGFSIFLDTTAFPTGAAAGDFFTIFGDIPIDRLADFQTAGDFNAATINIELDKLTQIAQEINTKLIRSLRISPSDPAGDMTLPVDRALKFLSFDALRLPVASDGTAIPSVPISSFWAPILSNADFPTSGIAALALVNAFTRAQGFTPVALTPGATVAWTGDTQQNATLLPVQNFQLDNITGARAGFTYILVITQDPVGGRVITFDTNYVTPGGALPVLSVGANDIDRIAVYAHSPTVLEVVGSILIS